MRARAAFPQMRTQRQRVSFDACRQTQFADTQSADQVCKPGSVFDSHLSRRAVADALKPPPRDDRAGLLSLHGVAPDRVYSIVPSPDDG